MTHGQRDFWDARAREDAYFFVDNRRAYGDADLRGFWSEGERDLEQILALLEVRIEREDVVLDIGCGVGRLTRPIAARAARAIGIDISAEMLARAREHHADAANIEWVHGDGCSLQPVEDASVDACVSHVVFQHIPNPEVTLGYVRDMGRVLRPGGWAVFQVSNAPQVHESRGALERLATRARAAARRGPAGVSEPSWLGSAVTLEQLHGAASDAALAIERVVGAGTQFCMVRARREAT